jgi:hypothetical protein
VEGGLYKYLMKNISRTAKFLPTINRDPPSIKKKSNINVDI